MNSVTKVKYIYNQDKNNETKKITSSSTIYKTIIAIWEEIVVFRELLTTFSLALKNTHVIIVGLPDS